MKAKRYRVTKTLQFVDFRVPRGTILRGVAHIPAWARTLLASCLPLHVNGKVRIVGTYSVKEIK